MPCSKCKAFPVARPGLSFIISPRIINQNQGYANSGIMGRHVPKHLDDHPNLPGQWDDRKVIIPNITFFPG